MDADKKHEYLRPLIDFLGVSNKESDRGRVLVAAAQIDSMLKEILSAFLLTSKSTDDLFSGPNAPMNSLYNKSNFATSLGLISEPEQAAINVVRKIRNEFAHSVHIQFDDGRVSALVLRIRFGLEALIQQNDPVVLEPRSRFGMATSSLISSLYNRRHYVSKAKLISRDWPS